MSGEDVEARSLAIIDGEAGSHGFSDGEWEVVRRMVHTSADFSLMEQVKFSEGAVSAAAQALRSGRPIYADSNMIRSGLSLFRLRQVCPEYGPERIVCHVADSDVTAEAQEKGLPRSLFAVRKARPMLDGGIAVFGNAPVALLELNRMIMEEGLKPAFVVAMPVGFVHVCESKDELMSLDVPYVAIEGRRGGSPLAVATIHALCSLALRSTGE
jgi:precorrin isomerase